MTLRVLIVDDSAFFRRRLTDIFKADPQLEVVGTAGNGQEAIDRTAELKPDVITMDIEMPVMDGITAVRRIMAARPTPILMFSSLTHDGAQATLDALDAGAADFLPKTLEDISHDFAEAAEVLRARVRAIARRGAARARAVPAPAPARAVAAPVAPAPTAARPRAVAPVAAAGQRYAILAIGASTGGPVALQTVLKPLVRNFPLPILVVQHMPAAFTGPFAQRLNQLGGVEVKEAQEGDILRPGVALLAPGGRQMVLDSHGGGAVVRIQDSEPSQHYRPCVDVTFSSIARGISGRALAVVLTGMGADGREGARLLKKTGATVWAQDERSCVVYGMPAAIVEAGLADAVLPLDDIGERIGREVGAWIS
jgi:two-component system, chemotaxis family, protein-glutamate methylesterase/glutaminase